MLSQYAMYVVHWVACIFYFIARQEHFTESSWLGAYPALLMQWPTRFDSYIFSLYWAVTTFATVGYGVNLGPPCHTWLCEVQHWGLFVHAVVLHARMLFVTSKVCLGAGDFHAESMPEALFCLIFMFLNVGITAYIIVRRPGNLPLVVACTIGTDDAVAVLSVTIATRRHASMAQRLLLTALMMAAGYNHHGCHQE